MTLKGSERIRRSAFLLGLCLQSAMAFGADCGGLLGGAEPSTPAAPILQYDDLITAPPGPSQSHLITLSDGRQLTVEVKRQAEFERRVNMPDATKGKGHISQNSVDTIASRLLQVFYPTAFESIKLHSYNGAVAPEVLWPGRFQLAPLSSRFEQFHNPLTPRPGRFPAPRKTREWKLGTPVGGDMVQEIYGGLIGLRPFDRLTGVDHVETKFLVGWQNEVALYFDTPGGDLEKQGVAVRLKAWFSKSRTVPTTPILPSAKDIRSAVRASLTIKVTHKEVGPFTQREEVHVAFPANLSLADIVEIAQIMVARIPEARAVHPLALTVRSRVDTERLAVNLTESSGETSTKVGFLTIDSFRRADFSRIQGLEDGAVWKGPVRQLEIELLPEFAVALLQDQVRLAELEKLFSNLEDKVGGVVTPTPKYLQPMPNAE